MSNIATTIEQSKYLLELGLDPKTADMFWKHSALLGNHDINGRITVSYQDHLFVGKYDGEIPAWSLSALLEVMCYNSGIDVYFNNPCFNSPTWCCHWIMREEGTITECSKTGASKIDAAFEVVRELIMNGYIKRGGDNGQA